MRYRLRARRLWLGLSQAEVARQTGLPPIYISMAECGKRMPAHRVRKVREEYAWLERAKLRRLREQREFDRHQALAAVLPDCPEVRAFRAAMLDRAWQHLNDGSGEECDAVLEFVPEADARALLDEYFYEDDNAPNPPEAAISEGSTEAREDGSSATSPEGRPIGIDLCETDEGLINAKASC